MHCPPNRWPDPPDRPVVFDDLDFDYVPTAEEMDNIEERQQKLKQAIATVRSTSGLELAYLTFRHF